MVGVVVHLACVMSLSQPSGAGGGEEQASSASDTTPVVTTRDVHESVVEDEKHKG